ncbi:DDT domain-containing protein DDB_G0282237 isoform X1 [Amborella trichopoda]|uniref:DDT domain-containing protein DDB_G0282237 isoform X1 n=1 Tax=Amborella trichopoda TaxID=13333 RepID=UPI0005D40374|nr:DDT domain-containing protein DDB_G0282237 isoform X1 [Amborella trichopoda]XP_020532133.1 DDT domain-containing protein DDB_G0282237 isoform X1 [Amborella trichopoda]XP_020532134.1 DDT domain-containing protein DDB_G0282237 isoform X1 [Amborella trichopoda]XP_020532135.1 DDT domain-containing protein DDB_G0282237 isoform X1 [Amborella trichopoda]|eukprot:XP_011628822.1 DDT domain-containing protein DDB_G0282237 isoform X1 [Amborella trichopoda]
MPLYKRTPFPLRSPPLGLMPNDSIFIIRFTNEIFMNYDAYLKRINLYRQRVWTCKITGKSGLTYEEALVSEQHASNEAQKFPEELVIPVLHMVQFSTLKQNDLVSTIYRSLQWCFAEGEETYGSFENSMCPCKILRVLEKADGKDGPQYEVGWLDKSKNVASISIVNAESLTRKKLPFTREMLKSFMRESTSKTSPWVVHDILAQKHGISREPPKEILEKIGKNTKMENGHGNSGAKKRPNIENGETEDLANKRKRKTEEKEPLVEQIQYPIDDLLVKLGDDDPVYTQRPVPATDFLVPMDCVGDLLMAWDFFSSFSHVLRLSQFSLDDFENAVVYKESDSDLIVEAHSSILRMLIKDESDYYTSIQEKKRDLKITSKNWTGYLCEFLQMETVSGFSGQLTKIRDGHHFMLDVKVKLNILSELVYWALMTEAIRGQLDEYIEQCQAIMLTKREEELEDLRKRKEQQQQQKEASLTKGSDTNSLEALDSRQNGDIKEVLQPGKSSWQEIVPLENGGNKQATLLSRRIMMKQKLNAQMHEAREKKRIQMEERKRLRDKGKQAREKKLKEKRQEHFNREIEKRIIRTSVLGKDRDYNRYWFFCRDGRLFVESANHNQWGFYSSKEELDGLLLSLNPKGDRERALKGQVEKHYNKICAGIQKRSKEIAQRNDMDTAVLRRSIRVHGPRKCGATLPFLNYGNKLKTDL